ncbi:MAG TPA: choice-of-anchor D domain-containing protein [Acidisarcina sp.]
MPTPASGRSFLQRTLALASLPALIVSLSGAGLQAQSVHLASSARGLNPAMLGFTHETSAAAAHGFIVFTPQLALFGNVGIGTTSQPIAVTVTNNTATTAHYVAFNNLRLFHIDGGTCGPISISTTLAPGASCTFSATFSPTAPGLVVGSFTIASVTNTVRFQLKGNGVAQSVIFFPSPANFGSVAVGTMSAPITVKVGNYTGSPITYSSFTSFDSFNFLPGGSCNIGPGATLAADSVCTFSLNFEPLGPGPVNDSFNVTTSYGTLTYHVIGTGVAPVGP